MFNWSYIRIIPIITLVLIWFLPFASITIFMPPPLTLFFFPFIGLVFLFSILLNPITLLFTSPVLASAVGLLVLLVFELLALLRGESKAFRTKIVWVASLSSLGLAFGWVFLFPLAGYITAQASLVVCLIIEGVFWLKLSIENRNKQSGYS